MARNDSAWRAWYDKEDPEKVDVPDFQDRLDFFHKLLVVRAMRTDRALLSAKAFVEDTMGPEYIDFPPLNWESTLEESSSSVPLICILSPGADPSESILALAKKRKKECKAVSMGQGQEIIARRLISTAVTTGNWVLLQNTHLGLKFLVELEQTLLGMEEVNPEFRL